MPWVEQATAGGTWELLFVFDERRDQYSEMDNITYEDAMDNRYETDPWVDQPVAGGVWA